MWENEIIMFRFAFYILIGIFLLMLALLVKSHFDHRELMDALARLPAPGCQKDEDDKR